MLPDPLGGASIGDLYAGVPAVVESPSATMVIMMANSIWSATAEASVPRSIVDPMLRRVGQEQQTAARQSSRT
jgi:hypothetical protein